MSDLKPEIGTHTVVKIIVSYQHELAYCVFTSHIKIEKYEAIIMIPNLQ